MLTKWSDCMIKVSIQLASRLMKLFSKLVALLLFMLVVSFIIKELGGNTYPNNCLSNTIRAIICHVL